MYQVSLQEYWSIVREWRSKLPDPAYITTMGRPGSTEPAVTTVAGREEAAKAIAGGTHRPATPEEEQAYKDAEAKRDEACKAEALKKKLQYFQFVPGEAPASFSGIAAGQTPNPDEHSEPRKRKGSGDKADKADKPDKPEKPE